MKTLFTLTTIVLIVIASLVSFSLFEYGHYTISALLVLTSFLSTTLWIHVVSNKKLTFR